MFVGEGGERGQGLLTDAGNANGGWDQVLKVCSSSSSLPFLFVIGVGGMLGTYSCFSSHLMRTTPHALTARAG